ncbi:MAG: LruC domain-containing protein, partial [Bacteroidota bacterium]|nr:LruC domain-containing protein [Bacteroidota bacterium]
CGSSQASGLGINFVNIDKSIISDNIVTDISGSAIQDPDVENAVIVYNNHFEEQSSYYTNTSYDKIGSPANFNFHVDFVLSENVSEVKYLADFFYFRSSNRGREIHMPGFSPTSAADNSLFGTYDDDPDSPYSTVDNLPWGLEIVTINRNFKHPLEKCRITNPYVDFGNWAHSNGSQYQNWKDNYEPDQVFTMP